MIYLLMFFISTLFFYYGDHYKGRRKHLISAIGMFFPVLLAALRSENVGIDILTYVKPMYICAIQSDNLMNYYILLATRSETWDLEKGFTLVGYISTKIFGNLQGVLFMYALLIILFIYLAINVYNTKVVVKYNKKPIKSWLVMLFFFCVLYNMSLTMIRQSVACAIAVFALMSLIAGNRIRAFVFLVIAMSMHSTSAIVLLAFIFYLSFEFGWRKVQKISIPIGLIIAIAGGRMYWLIMNTINIFIPLPGRYLSMDYMWGQGNGVNLAFIFLLTCTVFCDFLLWSKKNKGDVLYSFDFYMVFFSAILIPMSIASANLSRILYYFFYWFMFVIPLIENEKIKVRFLTHRRHTGVLIAIAICLIYWLGTTGFNDYTGTINYELFFM